MGWEHRDACDESFRATDSTGQIIGETVGGRGIGSSLTRMKEDDEGKTWAPIPEGWKESNPAQIRY